MLRTLTRGLAAAAVVGALLVPAPLAVARPHLGEEPAATAPPSIVALVGDWLAHAWRGLFAASSTAADDDEGETPVLAPVDPLFPLSSAEDDGERGPYIDPNG